MMSRSGRSGRLRWAGEAFFSSSSLKNIQIPSKDRSASRRVSRRYSTRNAEHFQARNDRQAISAIGTLKSERRLEAGGYKSSAAWSPLNLRSSGTQGRLFSPV